MRNADGFAGDINRADLAVDLEGSRVAGGAHCWIRCDG